MERDKVRGGDIGRGMKGRGMGGGNKKKVLM
jgi:hypothetical protein